MSIKQGIKGIFETARLLHNGDAIRGANSLLEGKAEQYANIARRQANGEEVSAENSGLVKDYSSALSDKNVLTVFEKFRNRIEDGHFRTSGLVIDAFHELVEAVPEKDALSLARMATADQVFRKSVMSLDYGDKRRAIYDLSRLAEKVPTEDKLKFFQAIERNGLLKNLFDGAPDSSVANLLKETFDGVDIDSVKSLVGVSDALDNVVPSQEMGEWLVEKDHRLVGLMQFMHGHSDNGPNVSHNDM